MKKLAIYVTVSAIAIIPAQAFAWGKVGHAVVADIAADNLTPSASRQVYLLLRAQGKTQLFQIASWADRERDLVKKGMRVNFPMPMHSIRIPLKGFASPEANCPVMCATSGITFYLRRLKDRSLSIADRAIALNFVVHLVGDIHQPLHASTPTGTGQKVIYRGLQTNLHAIWDNNIIGEQSLSANALAKELEGGPTVESGGDADDWAIESNSIVRKDIAPQMVKGVLTLPDDYAVKNWPIVRTRLKQAGLRLAILLNSALG